MGDICSFCGFLANYRIDYKTVMNRVWFGGSDLGLFFVLSFWRFVLLEAGYLHFNIASRIGFLTIRNTIQEN